MCLWGKGRVENHWRRGDSSFSRPPSPRQHHRKSLCMLRCTTALLHAPAQTHRQMNRREGVLLAPIKELTGFNLAIYNLSVILIHATVITIISEHKQRSGRSASKPFCPKGLSHDSQLLVCTPLLQPLGQGHWWACWYAKGSGEQFTH